jgi:hypothetical protein
MDFKASLGICRNCQDKGGDHKLLVVPQDPELFEKNELMVIISAADFKELTHDLKKLIRFLESAKECVEE